MAASKHAFKFSSDGQIGDRMCSDPVLMSVKNEIRVEATAAVMAEVVTVDIWVEGSDDCQDWARLGDELGRCSVILGVAGGGRARAEMVLRARGTNDPVSVRERWIRLVFQVHGTGPIACRCAGHAVTDTA
jgi:hypothetical protein